MEGEKFLKNSQIIILGICVAVATIISSLILSSALIKIKKFTSEVISVTGSAEKEIISDYIVWRAGFSRRSAELTSAFSSLQHDLEDVKIYLITKGVDMKEIIVSQINTMALYKKNEKGYDTNEIEGYQLSQNIEIRSTNVYEITKISRESTELINRGIGFFSYPPEYFYGGLGKLKIEMLAKATQDAKIRAENMAKSAGNRIGVMRSAKMGVFQITPINSTVISDYGINDTTSLEKKVTAVVRADFAIAE